MSESVFNKVNKRTRKILRAIARIGGDITKLINQPVKTATAWAGYKKKLSEIDVHMADIKERWARFAGFEIPERFDEGVSQARKVLKQSGTPAGFLRKERMIIEDQMVLDMFDGLDAGRKDIRRLFRATQQHAVRESAINAALLRGAEIGTPRALKSELLKTLEARVGDGKIITVNAAGVRRRWKPETYAKMVARTRTREAQSQGTIRATLEAGHNLVRVSDHNTETEICLPFEGQIFSLDGKGGFDTLGETPPFHPNCLHVLTPAIVSPADTTRGQVQRERMREINQRNKAKLEEIQEKRRVRREGS